MTLAEKQIELDTILSMLNDDEREVVIGGALDCARGMAKGRAEYGPLDLARMDRDWDEEIAQESRDLVNYGQMQRIQRERRRRR